MKNTILIITLATTLFSCKKVDTNSAQSIDNVKDTIVKINPLFVISTPSVISTKEKSQTVLTNENAVKTLNNHFKSKGFLTQDEIEKNPSIRWLPENKDKNVIEFSELFLFNNQFGIITYYNAPPGAVGHCVQPHTALISSSDKGFSISNEEFLPTNFTIDSLKTIENKHIIYSNDYDCYNKKSVKNYRIELK